MTQKERFFKFIPSRGEIVYSDEDSLFTLIEEWIDTQEREGDDLEPADFCVSVAWMTQEEYDALPSISEAEATGDC